MTGAPVMLELLFLPDITHTHEEIDISTELLIMCYDHGFFFYTVQLHMLYLGMALYKNH